MKGKLFVTPHKKLHVKHIKVNLFGETSLHYVLANEYQIRQNITYIDMELYLWRKDNSIKDDGLCPGIHEFPFEFPLPPNIPSSSQFQSFGGVRYTCTAIRRGKLNSQFIVTARMDFRIFSKIFRFQMQYSKYMAL